MYEFTMEELAHYTGRSLATFKRDFKKISDLTPEKWLIRKRLEAAYVMMQEGGKKIREMGVRLESLAIVESMTDDSLTFRPNN